MAPGVHARNTQSNKKGNGRSPAENAAYAQVASLSRPRAVRLASIKNAREGRRAKIVAQIIAADGPLPPDELDRAVRAEIGRQLAAARAKALTARRKAREAADRARQADDELLDVTGLADSGSDGVDAA